MNDKPEIEVGKLPVITKFIYTLGVLPTSYLMSMTYQEQVTWLYNYLQTQVIPLLNTESEAIQELQTLYELLRTYVNDYFDNLDVQEEINNKLDEMVENGTFDNLVKYFKNSYLYGNNKNAVLQVSSYTSDDIPIMPATKSGVIDYGDFDRVGKGYIYDDRNFAIGNKMTIESFTNNTITLIDELPQFLKENMYCVFYDDSSYETPVYLSKIVSWDRETKTITIDGFTDYETKEDTIPSSLYGVWINPYTKFYHHYDYLYLDKDVSHGLYQADIYNYSDKTLYNGFSPVIRHGNGGVAFRARTGSVNSKWTTAFGTDGEGSFDNLLVNKSEAIIDGQNRYRQPFQFMTDTSSTFKSPVKKIYNDTNIADLLYENGSIIKILNGRGISLKLTGVFDGATNTEITQIVIPPYQGVIVGLYDDIYRILSSNYTHELQHIPKYVVNQLRYGFIPITQNTNIDDLGLEVGDIILCIVQNGITLTSESFINSNSYASGKTITTDHWKMGFIYRASAGSYWTSL